MPDLGKQVGPLPLGAWVAVVGGSLAFMVYSRSRSKSSEPVEVAAGPDAGVGVGGVGAVGAYTATDGGVAAPSSATAEISSNSQWSRAAFNFLVSDGADGAVTDRALRQYLDGNSLSVTENALITRALAKFGQVPEGLPMAPEIPVPPVITIPSPVPTPVSAPAPYVPAAAPAPAPAPATTVTVRPGDTLSGIAARYWQPWITWQSIYNANRGIIG